MVSCSGFVIGPVMGSFLFGLFGYVRTFYFFTVFIFSIGFGCIFFMPSYLNNNEQELQVADEDSNEE